MQWSIFATSDATIYDIEPTQNTGQDSIIEFEKSEYVYNSITTVYGSRILMTFSIDKLKALLNTSKITNPQIYLKVYNTEAWETPDVYTINVYPLSESWQPGLGKKANKPISTDGVSWYYRSGENRSIYWTTGSYNANVTGSYETTPGGGCWYTHISASQTLSSSLHLNINVTDIVNAWVNNTIPNNGIILMLDSASMQMSSSLTLFKYFGADSHTIYKPKLNVFWDNSTFTTGSATTFEYTTTSSIYYTGSSVTYPSIPWVQFTESAFYITSPDTYIVTSGALAVTGDFISLGQTNRDWYGMTTSGSNVYASVNGGDIYIQSAGIGTFMPLSQTNRSWVGMTTSGSNVYAAAVVGDIYIQYSGSGSFTPSLQTTRDWNGMTTSGSNVYASVPGDDIYVQPNGSGSFNPTGQASLLWTCMATSASNVYAAVFNGDIYVQNNGSGSFNPTGQASNAWSSMVLAPDGNVYAATNGGDIYSQTDGSGSFNPLMQVSRSWSGMTTSGSNVYALTNGSTIYRQTVIISPPGNWYSVTGSRTYFVSASNRPILQSLENTDIVIFTKNLNKHYQIDSKAIIKLGARERYPRKTYATSSDYLTSKFLPETTYYNIYDLQTNDDVIPFDVNYTKVSCDNNGNYFHVWMDQFSPERWYGIRYKLIRDDIEEIFDNKTLFKVVKNTEILF